MKTYHVELRFTQPVLGTANPDPEIHERFIASKAPDAPTREEEVAALGAEAVEERGTTVFAKAKDGTPFLWDYQIKGFFKDACSAMREADGSASSGLGVTVYKGKIDKLIFVQPRNVLLRMPEGSEVGTLQRPLRAETMQGPRVAIAASEMVPAGTTCSFDVVLMASKTRATKSKPSVDYIACLKEWMAYGQLRGIGQWRNGGYGSFRCRVTDAESGETVFDNLG